MFFRRLTCDLHASARAGDPRARSRQFFCGPLTFSLDTSPDFRLVCVAPARAHDQRMEIVVGDAEAFEWLWAPSPGRRSEPRSRQLPSVSAHRPLPLRAEGPARVCALTWPPSCLRGLHASARTGL